MPSAAPHHRDRAPGVGGHHGVDLVVGAGRVVVVQHDPPGPGALGQAHGVPARGVPEAGPPLQLLVEVLGVVHEQVAASGQSERRLVVLPQPVGAGAEGGGTVVREIGDRGAGVGDAEAEGASPLVRDLQGEDGEALDGARRARLEPREPPRPAQLGRRDREVRRGHDAAQDLLGVTLRRHVEVGAGVGTIGAGEEGQALGVVPVEVPEEDRAREGPAAEERGDPADARARVEHQAGRIAVVGQGHARGVAPVAHVLGPRRGVEPRAPQIVTRMQGPSAIGARHDKGGQVMG